jgi:hypothetical protein
MASITEIQFRDDVFRGERQHPQCCFFEEFQSSSDPNETLYGILFCHISKREEHAEICKGDYLKCPLTRRKEQRDENASKDAASSKRAVRR